MAHKATTEILVSGVTPPSYNFTRLPSAGLVEADLSLFNAAPGAGASGIATLAYYHIRVLCSRTGTEGTFEPVPGAPSQVLVQCNSSSGAAQATIPARWWTPGYPYWYVEIKLWGKTYSGSTVPVCLQTSDSMYFEAYDTPLETPSISINANANTIVKEVKCTITGKDVKAILEDSYSTLRVNIYISDEKDGEYTRYTFVDTRSQEVTIDLSKWRPAIKRYVKFSVEFSSGNYSGESSQTSAVRFNDNKAYTFLPAPWIGDFSPVCYGNHLLTCLSVQGDEDGAEQTYKIKIGDRPEIQMQFNTPLYVLLNPDEYFQKGIQSILYTNCVAKDSLGEGSGDPNHQPDNTIVGTVYPLKWERGERIQKGDPVTATQMQDIQETVFRFYGGFFKQKPDNAIQVNAGDLVKAETITTLQNMIDEVLATTGLVTPPQWIRVKKGDKISAAPLNQLREFFEYL